MSDLTKSNINISFVILTYKRDDILATQARSLADLYQKSPTFDVVLVDNNADGVDRGHFFNGYGFSSKVVAAEKNLGVAGGRNLGVQATSANYLVFIDDDAILRPEFPVHKISEHFEREPQLGAIAFKSINPHTGCVDAFEFPHTKKEWIDRDESFLTFRYIGVGHALRNDVLKHTGLYDESFFYGMEEFDLSYRLIDAGFQILYDPQFKLEHHRHMSGRLEPDELWKKAYANKLKLAFKNLPYPYCLSVSVVWFMFVCIKTRSLGVPIGSLKLFNEWRRQYTPERSPVNKDSIAYIHSCSGNMYV